MGEGGEGCIALTSTHLSWPPHTPGNLAAEGCMPNLPPPHMLTWPTYIDILLESRHFFNPILFLKDTLFPYHIFYAMMSFISTTYLSQRHLFYNDIFSYTLHQFPHPHLLCRTQIWDSYTSIHLRGPHTLVMGHFTSTFLKWCSGHVTT